MSSAVDFRDGPPRTSTGREEDRGSSLPSAVTIDRSSLPPSLPITEEGHTFLYLEQEAVQGVKFVEKELYRGAVSNLPISCVDVFLYHPVDKTYLLVLRKDPPAQGVWWLPGGRIFKGETFFKCCERKCQEEVGLEVSSEKVLGSFTTIFPDSMWDTQTHSVNTVVLAFVKEQEAPPVPVVDETCVSYRWQSIASPPEDPYVLKAYRKALKAINKRNSAKGF